MNRGKVQVVVGGQFGSEGKGAVAARLCASPAPGPVAVVRVAGPNAGHSAVDGSGRKWALRQVPVAAVVNSDARLVICAGSEIDEEVLDYEVATLDAAGFDVSSRLYIDGQATVITPTDKAREAGGMDEQGLLIQERIGSTAKGIGAARASRIMREAPLWSDGMIPMRSVDSPLSVPTDTAHMLAAWLQSGRDVIIEGTQGYGLGLHAGWYPYCTSSDCRAIDFLAMAGISPWAPWVSQVEPWVVLRTYPIRVAGNSGPMLDETSWEQLGHDSGGHIQPEYTTVTKKVRRVGQWDPELAQRAVAENGRALAVALTFFDYWYPELAGACSERDLTDEHRSRIATVEKEIGARVRMLGTGPDSAIWLENM